MSLRSSVLKAPLQYIADRFKRHNQYSGPENRRMPRFEVDVEVVAFSNNSSFRTRTVNLSLSGALLKDVLPQDFTESTLDVVVVETRDGRKNRILLKAKAVGGPFKTPRITFIKPGTKETQSLQDIITFGATSMVPL